MTTATINENRVWMDAPSEPRVVSIVKKDLP